MTKNEMVISIAAKTGVEQREVRQVVQLTLDGIIDVIAAEKRLELGDFGVFEVRMLAARTARNPRTGAPVQMASRPKVFFKTGKILAAKVNGIVEASSNGNH